LRDLFPTMPDKNTWRPALRAAVLPALAALISLPALAGPQVLSPIVDAKEIGIELKANRTSDSDPERDAARGVSTELSLSVTPWWATELEPEWQGEPRRRLKYSGTSWENRFQLTPQGEYWLDAGLLVEYERAHEADEHNSLTVGALLQTELGGSNLTTLNLLFTRELGEGGAPGLSADIRLQSRWRLNPHFEPGFEVYWEPGRWGHFEPFEAQRLRAGPVLAGMWRPGGVSKIKYEVGYLFGLNGSSERGTLRALLEFETRY
jgi:hypothetical protein